ncbi:MAG: alpha/beta hydrolase [Propionibacteriaceae bacterium]|nr:alpha/beta hydrolase [Propionibacteriaceae bacterium]
MTLLPPGARETFVSAIGGRWRVLEGERPLGQEPAGLDVAPILLIHGGGYDAAAISWYRLIGPLSAMRRVIAPDLPGCGGTTEVPLPGAPSAAADQLVTLLDALGVDRVVACGVSMGGDIALELALRYPTRLAGLVCIAPGGLMPSFGSAAMQRLMWLTTRASDRGMALISRLSRPLLSRVVRDMVHDPATLPPEAVAEFLAEARRPDGGVAYGSYNRATVGPRAMLNDKSRRVGSIELPALFFHGQQDGLVSIDGSRRAVAAMPNARLVEVDDCGHWAQLEQHERFLAELTTFLAEVDAASY